MALVAQYNILSDESFTLDEGSEKRLMFNPEDAAYLEDTQRHAALLMYSVDPSEDAHNIEIEVWARIAGQNKRISVLRVNGGHLRTVTEPINPQGMTTADNRLWFKVTQGRGSVRISNVVMWYKRVV